MNTRELIAVLNSLAENDLTNGSDIVEHPAHIAAITLMQNEGRIVELETKNAILLANVGELIDAITAEGGWGERVMDAMVAISPDKFVDIEQERKG